MSFDIALLIFYVLALLVVGLGILSLRSGFDFGAYVRSQLDSPRAEYTPFVSVIAPCRGLELGLAANLAVLSKQNYSAYEILFVVDSPGDKSVPVIEEAMAVFDGNVTSRLVVAGHAIDAGQKVHNLRVAVDHVSARSEVFVFVDSDARPHEDWLRDLVAPLANESIGATTGYRWFVPAGSIASHLRSVWNASIASALGANTARNFCWGGSTAIRRTTFDQLKIREAWRGTISDDFAVTRALQQARYPIHFVPACLIPSQGESSIHELFEFTNRQLKITRVYAPHLWRPLLIGSFLFNLAFFGGICLVLVYAATGRSFVIPLSLLAIIFGLGAAKSWVRLWSVREAMKKKPAASGETLAHLLLWPLASALYLWNALVAAFSRRIEWRGITYELKSPTEAVIIRNQADNETG